MPRAAVPSGKLLGRYVLHGEIASGGMATVSFGRVLGAAGFARTVAIKRLLPHLAKDPEFCAMFLDEARLAARVRHPNVVATLDVVAEGDELFLVMEYVPGEALSSLTRAGERVPPGIAASVVCGALGGLHAAHEARGEDGRALEIVHRDVSPHNILVGEDGLARVLDFGIARAAVRSHSTRDGRMKGKLRYMAPEQLKGAPATRRADVYAASVTLWEVLTGERLFDGDTDAAVYGRVLEGVVPPPSARAHVPAALDAVVLRGLARDPAARWATAQEMAEALERAVPPASAREVTAWLASTAGPVLSARAQRVQAIEAGFDDDAPPSSGVVGANATRTASAEQPIPDSASPPLVAGTLATATVTMPVVAPRKRRGAVVAGAALVIAAVAALGASRAALPRAEAARSGVGRAVLLATLRARALEPAPAASASAAPVEPAVVSASASASAAPVVKRRAHAAAPARSECDPPTYLDSTGIRRVKRGCL